jgi:hypothetical protein
MFNEYNYLCDTHTCGLYYRFYCSVLWRLVPFFL